MNDSKPPIELNIKELYRKSIIDLYKKPIEPPVCIEFGGVPIATFGNFSLLTGRAKSKKTFFISLIVKSLISENYQDEFISSPDIINEFVLIDTEQSNFDVYNVANRMITNPNDKKKLKVYSLRTLGFLDRIRLLNDLIENIKPKSFLLIDGLRDLVSSVNDEEQASAINHLLLRATEEKQIHIMGVLHQNKTNNNPRGHLGTEMINKAETVIKVTKVNSLTSKVEALQCRRKEFSSFKFTIDKNGIPLIDNSLIKVKKSNRKKLPSEVDKKIHEKILKSIAKRIQSSKPNYNEIIKSIKENVKKYIEPIGTNKAKDYFKYYESKKNIIQKGLKHSSDSYYKIDI
ncbi:MAG: hypothetical protein ROO71_13015 [Balneola sp.]